MTIHGMASKISARAFSASSGLPSTQRPVRHGIAKLVTKCPDGTLMKRPVSVWISGPGSNLTTIPAWVGDVFLASKPSSFSPVTNTHPSTCSLLFCHSLRQFTHGEYPSPRLRPRSFEADFGPVASSLPYLEMPHNLGGKHVESRSLATLYALGDMHTIVLKGTADGEQMRCTNTRMDLANGTAEASIGAG